MRERDGDKSESFLESAYAPRRDGAVRRSGLRDGGPELKLQRADETSM